MVPSAAWVRPQKTSLYSGSLLQEHVWKPPTAPLSLSSANTILEQSVNVSHPKSKGSELYALLIRLGYL